MLFIQHKREEKNYAPSQENYFFIVVGEEGC